MYEMWCYLTVLVLVKNITGCNFSPEALLKYDGAFRLNLHKDQESSVKFEFASGRVVTVTYNKRFAAIEDSILIPQKPDILVTLEGAGWPPFNLLLDAKYRFKYHNNSVGPGDDAINVLHRYRDAILQTAPATTDRPKRSIIQAAALFPHSDSENSFEQSVFWKSLKKFGIGAIPFLPSEKRFMKAWLETILKADDWSVAEGAINHLAIEQREDWKRAASETVLIGILPTTNTMQRLDWIIQSQMYYMPIRKKHYRQHTVKCVAIYEPKANGGLGAIAKYADVLSVEETVRSKIETPWKSTLNDQEVLLYRLTKFREFDKAIENQRSERMSRERWTSRLALERARRAFSKK